jgi:protein-S-isoprenylcysteine O-methyltransferase Ste14
MEAKIKSHKILSTSFMFYFALFVVGILVDLIFPTQLFKNMYISYLGLVLIILGSFLIFWLKINSKKIKKEVLEKGNFSKGLYRYTSIPTHWGMFLLILGFGIMINAFFMVIITTISFFVTLPVFLKMQKNVLTEKYGEQYKEYKKTVRF